MWKVKTDDMIMLKGTLQ